jgi:putative ABC transport system substrate-binding protein
MIARRQLIAALGGAAAAAPMLVRRAAEAQPAMPVVGILASRTRQESDPQLAYVREGLLATGFVEGRNVAFEYRPAENHLDRLPALAADLVRHPVAVILALQGSAPPIAAKTATSSIPIVFASGGDPVKLGLVSSLNRPGGNITGISFLLNALSAKRLELLHELVPAAKMIGLLGNPDNPSWKSESRDVESAARSMGVELVILTANNDSEIDAAFAVFAERHVDAFLNAADQFFDSRHERIVALATRYRLPAMYHLRDFTDAGGLMSYGTSVDDAHRLAGTYVGRILKGEKPGDLPVQQSVKVELVINMKTAKTLGLTFPLTLLGRADEVIE